MKKISGVSIGSLLCIVAGCSLYTAPKVEPVVTPRSFKENLKIKNPGIEMHWWKNFNDPNLNKLVRKARRHNPKYNIALKNITVARTFSEEAGISRMPDVNLGTINQNYRLSDNYLEAGGRSFVAPTETINFNYLFGSVTYELDIWNKKANASRRSDVNLEISKANSRAVQLMLISEVVNTYFQISGLNAIIINYENQYKLSRKNRQLTYIRYKNGLTDNVAYNKARIDSRKVNKNKNDSIKAQKIKMHYLAYLLGEYPEQFNYPISPAKTMVDFNSLLPGTMPSQVLAYRPDIQKAFLAILSFGYLEKETLAGFFPSFSMFGFFGTESFSILSLAQSSILYFYGISVVEQLTDFAKNLSRYERSQVQYKQAVLNYKDKVLNSFREVDDALASYTQDYQNLLSQRSIVSDSYKQYHTAFENYKSGTTDRKTLIEAQANLLTTKRNLMQLNVLMYRDIVQIYKSIGIGADVSLKCMMACPPKPKPSISVEALPEKNDA